MVASVSLPKNIAAFADDWRKRFLTPGPMVVLEDYLVVVGADCLSSICLDVVLVITYYSKKIKGSLQTPNSSVLADNPPEFPCGLHDIYQLVGQVKNKKTLPLTLSSSPGHPVPTLVFLHDKGKQWGNSDFLIAGAKHARSGSSTQPAPSPGGNKSTGHKSGSSSQPASTHVKKRTGAVAPGEPQHKRRRPSSSSSQLDLTTPTAHDPPTEVSHEILEQLKKGQDATVGLLKDQIQYLKEQLSMERATSARLTKQVDKAHQDLSNSQAALQQALKENSKREKKMTKISMQGGGNPVQLAQQKKEIKRLKAIGAQCEFFF